MRLLGISGSLRAGSHNTAILRAAARLLPDGAELDIYGELESLPPYNQDRDTGSPPEAVAALRELIDQSDGVLFATPEYNGTMPGQMKQVVDWGSRPYGSGAALFGKLAAVIGASITDYGAIWAQDHLRKALGIAGARVLAGELPLAKAPERFDSDGVLVDLEIRDRLVEIFGELVEKREQLTQAVA